MLSFKLKHKYVTGHQISAIIMLNKCVMHYNANSFGWNLQCQSIR